MSRFWPVHLSGSPFLDSFSHHQIALQHPAGSLEKPVCRFCEFWPSTPFDFQVLTDPLPLECSYAPEVLFQAHLLSSGIRSPETRADAERSYPELASGTCPLAAVH